MFSLVEENRILHENGPGKSKKQADILTDDSHGRRVEVIRCNETNLQVISYGNYPPSRTRNDPPLEIIVVGTGNPGVPGYYDNFARGIHNITNIPVWVPSLVGFVNNEHLSYYNHKIHLEGQIKTRKEMFLTYLKRVRVICMDHSTSCYITIHLLKCPECSPIISDAFFIMPVLNKPDNWLGNLIYLTLTFRISTIGEIFFWLNDTLPRFMRNGLFRLFCDKTLSDFLTSNLTLDCYQKFIRVAKELLVVTPMREIPYGFFENNAHRLHFYLSMGDVLRASWCTSLSEVLPKSDVRFSPNNERHAFFVNDWEHVAKFLAKWVIETKERASKEAKPVTKPASSHKK